MEPIADPKCVEVRAQLRGAILYYKRASENWFASGLGSYAAKQNRQINWQKAHARIQKAEQLLAAMG